MSMSMLMSIVRNTLPVVVVLISCVAPLARCQRSEGNSDSSVLLNAAAVLAVFHSIVAVTNLHTESRQIKMMASPTRVWRSLATTALLHFRTCGSAAPVLVHRIDSAICQMAHVRKCTSVKTTSERAREREREIPLCRCCDAHACCWCQLHFQTPERHATNLNPNIDLQIDNSQAPQSSHSGVFVQHLPRHGARSAEHARPVLVGVS